MKKLPLLLFIFLSVVSGRVMSQELPIFDQYHFNYYLINPAVAGADKCSHLMLTSKTNWLGLDGANTQALTFRTRFTDTNIGLGAYVYNDQTPNFRNTGGQVTFAYHIPMSDGSRYLKNVLLDRQLSFGVSFKLHQSAYTSMGTDDPADVSDSEIVPNANVGVYYVDYGFFAGLSVTNLIPYEVSIYQQEVNPLTAFLFTGYSFDLKNERFLEPSINFNYNKFSHKQFDLNLKYTKNNQIEDFGYWAQLSYRHNFNEGSGRPHTLIPIIGVRLNKVQLAYAFNLTLNELASHNYGTHELMLAYTFCVPKHFCR